jgi:hypothetical protein
MSSGALSMVAQAPAQRPERNGRPVAAATAEPGSSTRIGP